MKEINEWFDRHLWVYICLTALPFMLWFSYAAFK